MAQLSKISRNNTTVSRDSMGRVTAVTLHATRILSVNWDAKRVVWYTGGYNTVTTQTRMNQTFNECGLPFIAVRSGGNFRVEPAGAVGEWVAENDLTEVIT